MPSKSHGLDRVCGDRCSGYSLILLGIYREPLGRRSHHRASLRERCFWSWTDPFQDRRSAGSRLYQPSERTSPLIGDAIQVGLGLPLIKFVSAVLGAGIVALVFLIDRDYRSLRLPLPLIVATAVYIGFEHHQILWGMAGMETQIVCLSCCCRSICCMAAIHMRWEPSLPPASMLVQISPFGPQSLASP